MLKKWSKSSFLSIFIDRQYYIFSEASVQCSLFKIGTTDLRLPSDVDRNKNYKRLNATKGVNPFDSNYNLNEIATTDEEE